MSAKTRAEVFVQPKHGRPLKRTAIVLYANKAELKRGIQAYAATVWISAKRIDVDTSSAEILVDGVPVANYALHTPGAPSAGALARHTLIQLAVIIAGLTLTASSGHLNALYLAGFALAGFGIYRIGLGVQRREA